MKQLDATDRKGTPLIRVELPVCPSCGHVGKLPQRGKFKSYCTGPAGATHKRVQMEPRTFREVR